MRSVGAMTFPCPLCHAKASELLQSAPPCADSEDRAGFIVQESTSDTAKQRAEHLAREHGWKLR